MRSLEGEVEEEWIVITVGIQFPGVRHALYYINASLLEQICRIFPFILFRHLFIFPKVVESWRIPMRPFIVAIMTEVILSTQIEAKEGIEASPSGCVLPGTVACK